MDSHRHVLMLAFPAQGHLNPALQFAKTLAKIGIQVTFTTTAFDTSRITIVPQGLSFVSFSDGYDDGSKPKELHVKEYMSRFTSEASNTLRAVIQFQCRKRVPCGLPGLYHFPSWAAAVALEYRVPSAILWIQPATVLVIYYCYFHEHEDDVKNRDMNDP